MNKNFVLVPMLSQIECRFIFDTLDCFMERLDNPSIKNVVSQEDLKEYNRMAKNIRIKLAGLL